MTFRLGESYITMAFLPRHLKSTDYEYPTTANTAFNMAFNTNLHFYDFCDRIEPTMDEEYNRAMMSFSRPHLAYLDRNYPFKELNSHKGVLVDIGGGLGQVCRYLKSRYGKLRFIVQERQNVIDQSRLLFHGEQSLPLDRLTFVVHDYLTEQPGRVALSVEEHQPVVYLLKHVLHAYDDTTCVLILSQVAKVLGREDSLIIFDIVLSTSNAPESPGHSEARLSSSLIALGMFGGKYRTKEEFEQLLQSTVPPLHICYMSDEEDSVADSMKVIEARCNPSAPEYWTIARNMADS